MLKTILFPTDFSEHSYQVLDVFADLRARGADTVVLLHVVDERSFQAMEHYAYARAEEVEKHILDSSGAELEEIAGRLRDQGFTVIPKVVVGVPVREILKAEHEDDVSLIVLGSHGRSNLQEILLGSVAEKVVRKCTKSVLVVKRSQGNVQSVMDK
jgi:nucleotide-binding universal stress UspA family protein